MNKSVLFKAVGANIAFLIVVAGIIYYLYDKSDKTFTIKDILIKNAIILIFVGLTEFTFLKFFGSKYLSLDPNIVKRTIVQNIKDIIEDF